MTADNADPIALTANTTYTVEDGTGPFTFSGIISGSYGVTKDGPGTLIFSGSNTFSGGLNVTGGTLKTTFATGGVNNSAFGAQANNFTVGDGGTLWFAAARSAGYHKGNLTIQSGGTVQIDDSDCSLAANKTTTLYGTAAVTGTGLWRFREAGVKMVVGGQDGVAANAKISVSNFEVRDTNFAVNVVNANDVLTISSTINQDSPRGITKTGAGKLVLTGANTFNGGLNVQEGTVHLNRETVCIPTATPITVGSAEGKTALLLVNGKSTTTGGVGALGNHTGVVNIYRGGTIKFENSDWDNYLGRGAGINFIGGGSINISAGYLYQQGNTPITVTGEGAQASINGNFKLNGSTTFDIQESSSILTLGWITNEGNDRAFTKIGNGTLKLTSGSCNGALTVGKLDADGTTMLNGGKVLIATATSFSSIQVNKGTVEITKGNLGSGTVTLADEGILLWNRNDTALGKSLQGTGLFQIRRNATSNYEPGDVMQSNFAGTIELLNNTRYRSTKNNFSTTPNQTTIKVNPTTEFWASAAANYYAKFDLSGDGAGSYDGSPRGAIRIDAGNSNFYGDVVLSGNALIGSASAVTGTFYGDIDTNGKVLTTAMTVNPGGTLAFAGNISGGGSITINDGTYRVSFGDPSDAAADAPTTQTISVSIVNNIGATSATNGLNFNVGANRTVEVTGAITNHGFYKSGAGTVRLTGTGDLDSITVAAGTVEWANTVTISGAVSGAGTFIGNLNASNKAIVSPGDGDTLASFAVNGDYTQNNQNSTGYLEIFVKNPENSKLNVTGNANMTNATIKLVKTSDAIAVDLLDYFDLVEADSFEENMLGTMSLVSALDMTYDNPVWGLSIVELANGHFALRATALDPNYVPEPATWVLMLMAVCCMLRVSGRPKDEP